MADRKFDSIVLKELVVHALASGITRIAVYPMADEEITLYLFLKILTNYGNPI